MGRLFAVALGMHLQSRAVVTLSLLPIAIGHGVSIAAIDGLLVAAGPIVPRNFVRIGSGLLLFAWAAYHWHYGHRHRVRFGMQTGLLRLAVWSLLMATAHGAGLMLWPALLPLCLTGDKPGAGELITATLVGVGIHTLAMPATTAVVAAIVFEWLGLPCSLGCSGCWRC